MADATHRTTTAPAVRIHPLALQGREFARLARQVLPFGFTARALPCTGLKAGDRVLAIDSSRAVPAVVLLMTVAAVYAPDEYPGVKLGSVVAVLEVRP